MIDIKTKYIGAIYFALFLLFAANGATVSAQNYNVKELPLKELKNTAKQAYRQSDIYMALLFYKEWVSRSPENEKLTQRTAELYAASRNYKEAEVWFTRLLELNSDDNPLAYFYLAEAQQNLGKYNEARENFETFRKVGRDVKDPDIRRLAKNGIISCEFALSIKDENSNTLVKNVGNSINKPHIEFSPIAVDDKTIIYGSLVQESENLYDEEWLATKELPTRKLYVAKLENGRWVGKGELDGPFNSDEKNIGNAVLNASKDRLYFTYCDKNWQNKIICKLYYSDKKNGKWQDYQELNSEINMSNYTSTQAAIGRSSKKNEEIIYFVSDRPGGKGGLDIWYTEYRKKRNSYRSPRNLGSKVNSEGDEATPYFDLATRKLYFSSNGHPGLGGYDIFYSTGEKSKWEEPVNMKADINSPADDLDFDLADNKEGGFFVSNRKGGTALLNETCCDDIYEFSFSEYVQINLKGKVLTKDDCLTNYKLKLYIKDKETEEMYLAQGKDIIDCEFQLKLESGIDYTLEIEKEGYLVSSNEISTKGISDSEDLTLTARIERIPTNPKVYGDILFEYNSPELTVESKKAIDNSLYKTLKENPTLKVKLGAHTDNKGSEAYNLHLSKKRAQALVDYLVSKGISIKRLLAVGYGESQPIAPNTNKDGSDNPEGRELNRRVEMEIIGSVEIEEED